MISEKLLQKSQDLHKTSMSQVSCDWNWACSITSTVIGVVRRSRKPAVTSLSRSPLKVSATGRPKLQRQKITDCPPFSELSDKFTFTGEICLLFSLCIKYRREATYRGFHLHASTVSLPPSSCLCRNKDAPSSSILVLIKYFRFSHLPL